MRGTSQHYIWIRQNTVVLNGRYARNIRAIVLEKCTKVQRICCNLCLSVFSSRSNQYWTESQAREETFTMNEDKPCLKTECSKHPSPTLQDSTNWSNYEQSNYWEWNVSNTSPACNSWAETMFDQYLIQSCCWKRLVMNMLKVTVEQWEFFSF